MKELFILTVLLTFFGCSNSEVTEEIEQGTTVTPPTDIEAFSPVSNQVQAVWSEVSSDPYETLPQETVSYSKLFDGARDLIFENAQRTLVEHADIIAPFDKLAHPNGVCMMGIWEIDTTNIYGGYFKSGSKALMIARASSAMSNTKRGENRAFGMAGKIFPTLEETELLTQPSANFFVIDDLGGTNAEYFTDVELTNEPEVSFTSSVFSAFAYGLKVASAFSDADENSGIRQLYEISNLGEQNSAAIITPKWMKIVAQEGQDELGVEDFRDEFILEDNRTLLFNIFVSSVELNGQKQWQEIGTITFDTAVASYSCDHRLHFHHPKWRDDLAYE